MYFEARGTADLPTVICSALSEDMLDWKIEEGIRLQGKGSVRAPRYLAAEGGAGRLYCCGSHGDQSGTCGLQDTCKTSGSAEHAADPDACASWCAYQ